MTDLMKINTETRRAHWIRYLRFGENTISVQIQVMKLMNLWY